MIIKYIDLYLLVFEYSQNHEIMIYDIYSYDTPTTFITLLKKKPIHYRNSCWPFNLKRSLVKKEYLYFFYIPITISCIKQCLFISKRQQSMFLIPLLQVLVIFFFSQTQQTISCQDNALVITSIVERDSNEAQKNKRMIVVKKKYLSNGATSVAPSNNLFLSCGFPDTAPRHLAYCRP